MAIENRDGDVLEDILRVGVIPHRRRNERVDNGLRNHPRTGNGFILRYSHGHLSRAIEAPRTLKAYHHRVAACHRSVTENPWFYPANYPSCLMAGFAHLDGMMSLG
jgi:hypothetical protein